jgi:hypothetical protein
MLSLSSESHRRTSHSVLFYERGVSRKNFSRAGGPEEFFDHQPPSLPVSPST